MLDLEQNAVILELNRARVLLVSDIVGRQAVISIGCAAENIVQGGQYFGLEVEVDYLEKERARVLFLQPGEQNEFVNR